MSSPTALAAPESQCAQPEHAAAAADVEDSLPSGDSPGQLFEQQPGRGVLAGPEPPARVEFDHVRQAPAVVLRPREAQGEPLSYGDGPGVADPGPEAGAAGGSKHGELPLGAKAAHEHAAPFDSSSTGAISSRRVRSAPYLHSGHPEVIETGPGTGKLVFGRRQYQDHHAMLPYMSGPRPSPGRRPSAREQCPVYRRFNRRADREATEGQ